MAKESTSLFKAVLSGGIIAALIDTILKTIVGLTINFIAAISLGSILSVVFGTLIGGIIAGRNIKNSREDTIFAGIGVGIIYAVISTAISFIIFNQSTVIIGQLNSSPTGSFPHYKAIHIPAELQITVLFLELILGTIFGSIFGALGGFIGQQHFAGKSSKSSKH